MLGGNARRAHLADVRSSIRIHLRDLILRNSASLSWNEVYGETLAALEDIARCPAEELRSRAAACREKYCNA